LNIITIISIPTTDYLIGFSSVQRATQAYSGMHTGGEIRASKEGRTKFRITGRDLDRNAVMINGDSISISPINDSNLSVSVYTDGTLALDRRFQDFKLSDLKNGFLSSHWDNVSKVTKVTGDGEEWELVA
jgi:hypothetical protein